MFDLRDGAMRCEYTGNQDAIKAIVHVPEMGQYLSSCWDLTLRIWKAHRDLNTSASEPDPELRQSNSVAIHPSSFNEMKQVDLFPGEAPEVPDGESS